MIIQSLTVENLFSYQGKVTFDLSPRSPERPIVVIRARNGQGKTNLLNALKLGLGGLTDTLRADAASVGQFVTHNGYIWGAPHQRWEGIINRQARQRPSSEMQFAVTVCVQEGADTVKVRRSWTPEQTGARGGYAGNLEVFVNGGYALGAQEAEDLLHQVMPADLLPYFLFDGELVQRMGAFAGSSLREDVYRLMELNLIERLSRELKVKAGEWVREAQTAEVNARAVELENVIRRCDAEQLKVKEAQARHRADQKSLDAEKKDVERRLRQFDDSGRDDRVRLKSQAEVAEAHAQALRSKVFNELLPLSPLIVNETLAKEAFAQVDRSRLSAQTRDEYSFARILLEELPAKIANDPDLKDLNSEQRAMIMRVSRAYLAKALPSPAAPQERVWTRLSESQAAEVLRTLSDWSGLGATQGAREQLKALADAQATASELKERLAHTADLTVAQATERARLQGELGRLSAALERARIELERLDGELLRLGQERGRASRDLELALAERARREDARSRAGLAQRAADFTEALLSQAAGRRRDRVNTLINERFASLFSSSAQIGRLIIDDDMRLRLYTPDGRVVEPYNVSAGMRQLIAVSLLWALQGVSSRKMPVVMDTPVARLDREHQERVLFNYLPHASKQVILLPTDAELDDARLDRLAPHISHGYTLINQSGEATQPRDLVIPGRMP
ncbi:DNA sulfur modification protein DndD [Myxococcota bacterium]|nr:DNA sulfur modification protein DndD [Myxococcota bacterium]